MSEKFLDFSKETQAKIICILLSKMNPLKANFSEKSSRSSFYPDFEEKFWEFCHQKLGIDDETALFCPQDHFEGEKLPFEKTFSRFVFWF